MATLTQYTTDDGRPTTIYAGNGTVASNLASAVREFREVEHDLTDVTFRLGQETHISGDDELQHLFMKLVHAMCTLRLSVDDLDGLRAKAVAEAGDR